MRREISAGAGQGWTGLDRAGADGMSTERGIYGHFLRL